MVRRDWKSACEIFDLQELEPASARRRKEVTKQRNKEKTMLAPAEKNPCLVARMASYTLAEMNR
jgi:hypothetical protein